MTAAIILLGTCLGVALVGWARAHWALRETRRDVDYWRTSYMVLEIEHRDLVDAHSEALAEIAQSLDRESHWQGALQTFREHCATVPPAEVIALSRKKTTPGEVT